MRRLALALLLLMSLIRPLSAQARWSITLERGSTTFSAAAHDTSSPPIRLVPWHPVLYSLRVARGSDRSGWALALGYGSGKMGARVGEAAIVPALTLAVAEAAPEISLRIAATSSGATLRAHAGPVFDLWFPEGDDMRSTFGGLAGATLALPLAARWHVALRADLAITTSELTKQEASAQIIRAGTMRRGRLGVGITRGL